MTVNQYDEAGAISKFFVESNQTEANILANPQRCRSFIANNTLKEILFDKDLNPIILSPWGKITLSHGEPPAPPAGEPPLLYFDLDLASPYDKLFFKFPTGEGPGFLIWLPISAEY
jgi:hypothetical protein